MFKKQANAALVETQQEMEALMTRFEQRVFTAEQGDVKVSLFGTMELKTLDAPEKLSQSDFTAAYQQALAELKKERSVSLIKIRNNIQKRYRVDMSTIVPEMKEAIQHMDALQSS